MSSAHLFRWSGLAAVLGGGATALFNIALLSGGVPPAVDVYRTMITLALTMFALMGLYARQHQRAGILGLLGFVMAEVSLVLNVSFRVVLAFIAPVLVARFPEAVTAVGQGPYATVISATYVLFTVGYVLFGVATVRAGVLPAGGGWLFAIGAVASYVGMMLPINVGAILSGAGYVWLGCALWTGERAVAPAPRPQPAM